MSDRWESPLELKATFILKLENWVLCQTSVPFGKAVCSLILQAYTACNFNTTAASFMAFSPRMRTSTLTGADYFLQHSRENEAGAVHCVLSVQRRPTTPSDSSRQKTHSTQDADDSRCQIGRGPRTNGCKQRQQREGTLHIQTRAENTQALQPSAAAWLLWKPVLLCARPLHSASTSTRYAARSR